MAVVAELEAGEPVVDAGSGAGFDSFVAASKVGSEGVVIGIDMTDEMLDKSRASTAKLGLHKVEFRKGLPCAQWKKMMRSCGFVDVEIGPRVDTFAGAGGDEKARKFAVYGYGFLAYKPALQIPLAQSIGSLCLG